MEAVPSHLDPEEIRDALLGVEGVSSVHCLHVWTIGSSEVSLSSHLVIDPARDGEQIVQGVRSQLEERFSIEHTTIQIEPEAMQPGDEPACADACAPGAVPA
jgi:cobalt-zinc-cadmium efflux system protein